MSEAGEVIKQLWDLQSQRKTLQDDVNSIRCLHVSWVFPDLPELSTWIEGMTWAKMDLRHPFDEEEETDRSTRDEVLLVKVVHRME